MPISGKFFPSQLPNEEVFLLLRRHWFNYLWPSLFAVLTSIPAIVVVIYLLANPDVYLGITGGIFLLIVPAYILIVLGLMLFFFVDYYLDIYIVTNERIVNISQNGFFKRDVAELHLHQVQDVNAKIDGLFPTLLHFGDIYIQTAGERENFVFKSIPHPYRVSRKIVDLLEAQLSESEKKSEMELSKRVAEKVEAGISKSKKLEDYTGLNRPTFKLARERTKKFLKGAELIPTSKQEIIKPEVPAAESDQILRLIDKGEEDYQMESVKLPVKEEAEIQEEAADLPEAETDQSGLLNNEKNQAINPKDEERIADDEPGGEMKEDEEIHI